MSKRQTIQLVFVMALAFGVASAQDNSTQEAPSQGSQPQQPFPAYGQQTPPTATSENPPLSGMDMPSLEPNAAPLSYLQPGATITQSADSNAATSPNGQSFSSVSRALGNLTLRRLWSHYDLAIDYQGGVGYYTIGSQGVKLLQQLDLSQKVLWKRGQLVVRDGFSYLPEGNFGAAYGSLGAQGIGSIAGGTFGPLSGGSALGSFGLVPRILNVSAAEVTENLTPKSSITAMGGYAFTHFYGNVPIGILPTSNASFIGVSQTSAQAGYNRALTSHTQVALVYAYQGFDFSVSQSAFHTHVIQALYGHRLSGRMDLLVGAGPQITLTDTCSGIFNICFATNHDTRLGVAGVFRLRYKFPRTMMNLSYHRYETSGSGLFAGAQSDIGSLSVSRPLSRVWSSFADIGYSHNSRLQGLSAAQSTQCVVPGQDNPNGLPPCPGVDARTYQYGFVGGGVHRQFGHDFHGFMSYQFNELAFDHSFCAGLPVCSRISHRQVITFGVDWTPRPIRLD